MTRPGCGSASDKWGEPLTTYWRLLLTCALEPFGIPGVEQVDFDALLRESDALSLHEHMTAQNYHLFGADVLHDE